MGILNIKELPEKKFQYDMLDNCYWVNWDGKENPISKVPLQEIWDWIHTQAIKSELNVVYESGELDRILLMSEDKMKTYQARKAVEDFAPCHALTDKDFQHLRWIFARLVEQHGENGNYDYMIRLKAIINKFTPGGVEIDVDPLSKKSFKSSRGYEAGKLDFDALMADKDAPLERRRGILTMDTRSMMNSSQGELNTLFSCFYPHWIGEALTPLGVQMQYVGISPYFDPIEKGTKVPEYKVIIHTPIRGPIRVEFEKVKVE